MVDSIDVKFVGQNDPPAVYFHGEDGAEKPHEGVNLAQRTQIQILAGGLDKVSNLRPLRLHDDDLGIMSLCLSCNHCVSNEARHVECFSKGPGHPSSYSHRQPGLGWRDHLAGEVFAVQAD